MTFLLTALSLCWFMNLKLRYIKETLLQYGPMTCTQIAARSNLYCYMILKWPVSNIYNFSVVVELFKKLWIEIPFVFWSANTVNNWKSSMTSTAAVLGRGWIEKMLHSLWSEWEIKGNSRSCVYETLWCFISHQEIQQYEAWWKTIANWARWN